MNEKTKNYLYSLLFKDISLEYRKRLPEMCNRVMEIAYHNQLSKEQIEQLELIYEKYFKKRYN